jgi:hypothetical protein
METPRGALCNDLGLPLQKTLTDKNPMAEVAAQIELREFPDKPLRIPRIVQISSSVCFMSNANAGLGLEFERLSEKSPRVLLGKPIRPAVAVDRPGPQGNCLLHGAPETLQVFGHAIAGCDNLCNIVEAVEVKKSSKTIPLLFLGENVLDPIVSKRSDFWEQCLPLFRDPPKMSENHQFHERTHSTLLFGFFCLNNRIFSCWYSAIRR